MKKTLLQTFALTTLFLLVFGFWQRQTYSEDEPNYAAQCGENKCCAAYHSGIDALKMDWSAYSANVLDQEKPASEITFDAFEGLRTYHCWLQYLCESVAYSGVADPQSVRGTGITQEHIGVIPGCQAPEDLSYESGWNAFIETLRTGEGSLDEIIQPNRLNFIPACDNQGIGIFYQTQNDYQQCLTTIRKMTGECEDGSSGCSESSTDLAELQLKLNQAHGDQKSRALETKFTQILNGLDGTVEAAQTAKEGLNALDQRYACSPNNCD